MDSEQSIATLKVVRDSASFKQRIFAFAALPQEGQRAVLDVGKTISEGAGILLAFNAAHAPLHE